MMFEQRKVSVDSLSFRALITQATKWC